MSTKPPSGLSASSRANESDSEDDSVDPEDLSDQIQVDASDDVTVEAAEEVTTESVTRTQAADSTPPPLSSLAESAVGQSPKPILPSFFGSLSPSLPLPGVTAPSDEPAREIGDDITTLARGINDDITRPAVTDDDDDEETKVEKAENVVRTAGRDEVTTALSEQASFEREKALRKSGPSLFDSGARAANRDVEFEDPDGEEAVISSADAISADPIDEDDDEIAAAADDDDIPDDEVVSADPDTDELDEEERLKLVARKATRLVDDGEEDAATFSKSPEPSPLVAALTARRPGSPPLGSPIGFGTRLPSPSGGYASLALQAPAPAPAPVSSPFGRLAPVPSGSPYGARASASAMPALQIPAPSGAAAAPSEGTGLFRPVSLPAGGVVAICGGFLILGIVIGAKAFGDHAPPPPITVISSRPAPPAMPAPVVQPVTQPIPSPSAATGANAPSPSTTPDQATPANPPPGGSALGAAGGLGAAPGEIGEPPTPPKPKRLLPPKPRKVAPVLDDPLAPAPKANKPAKPAKPSKAWVDPFAG
jgi:hypothetical protein